MLRKLKPLKPVEVGQGFSTRIALAALEQNALETDTHPVLVSVDPYPRFSAKDVPACLSLQLVEQPVQEVELEPLLEGCDFLFIDSSHVYKFESDVALEFSRVYPRLPVNTIFHIHDIFAPYEYPKDWIVKERRFWNEQYLLECFLMFNSAFEVYLPVHLLARQSEPVLNAVRDLPLDPKFKLAGSSLYLRRAG